MTTRTAAVLWDMDGTLIDSEPTWINAQTQLVARHGGTWTHEAGLQLVGTDMTATANAMRAKGVPGDDATIIGELTRIVAEAFREDIAWRPGARQLIAAARDAGIPQAIVTTSPLSIVRVVADALDGAIATLVTDESVTHGKPHPEPYLTAAERLHVDIHHCIALEDSPTGIKSARAAGALIIGIPHDAKLSPSFDWIHWSTLAGKTVDDLDILFHQRPWG
jgi:HAD superfamily hydrolase (TIGR01509 family)